jgi:hypothetical protein
MNLPRLRELAKAGKDGSIRPEELKELFEALPAFLDRFDGHCSRCNEHSTDLSPLVVDGPNDSRVCLNCFGDVIGGMATAHAMHSGE